MRLLAVIIFLAISSFTSAWAQEGNKGLQSNPADDLFELAQLTYQEALDSKDAKLRAASFEIALRQFTRFLQHHDDHPNALKGWYYSAICYDKLNNKESSLRCLRTVVARWKTGPLVAAAAIQVANSSYQSKQYEDAAAQFLLAAEQSQDAPTKRLALYRRALCFQKLGKDEETIVALEVILSDEASPYHLNARKALAHYYRNGGRQEEAYKQFLSLAKSGDAETQADAILQTALLARELEKNEELVVRFEKILATPQLAKWHGETQLFLMAHAAQQKDYPRVISLFERKPYPLKKEQATKRLLLAIQAYKASNQSTATTALYQKLKEIAPDAQAGFEASYVLLSRLYTGKKTKEFTKAAREFLKSYTKTHKDDRRLDNVRLMFAETEYGAKRFAEAARLYSAIDLVHLDPANHPEARFRLSSALREAGDKKGAAAALEEFLKHHPKDPRAANALATRGDEARKNKDYPSAIRDYDQLLTLTTDPKLREYAWSQKAEVHKATKDFPAVISTHETLLKKFPNRSTTATAASWFWIGWAQFRREDFKKSIPAFVSARKLDKLTFGKESTVHLALAHYSLEQQDDLQREVDHLSAHHPKTSLPRPLYAWLGVKVAAAGQLTKAWDYLPLAVNLKSPKESKTPVWLAYGQAALATKHFEEAIPAYEQLLSREDHDFRKADYHYRLAFATFHLKKYERSLSEAEAALEFKPRGGLNGEIRYLLGEIAEAQGTPETALQHYVVVVELYNEDQTTLRKALTAAIPILERQGDPDDLEQAQTYRKLLQAP